jgi:hypothetical protein
MDKDPVCDVANLNACIKYRHGGGWREEGGVRLQKADWEDELNGLYGLRLHSNDSCCIERAGNRAAQRAERYAAQITSQTAAVA